MRLKTTAIFYSIQGEATYSGTASIFIRLHGCNLSCSFCDDDLHTKEYCEKSFDEILDEIERFTCKRVIITGGEPSIYDLNPFIEYLQDRDYFISIETNGYKLSNISKANWITYSPKDWSNILEDGFDEYKFIVGADSDISPILELKSNKPIYIQPMNYFSEPNMDSVRRCVEIVLKYPHLKLSVQLHKFLGLM